jgi:hypothetical protein
VLTPVSRQLFRFRVSRVDAIAFSRFSARRSLRARADCFELLTADLSAIVGPFRIGNRELTSTIPNKRNKSSSAAD